MLSEHGTLSIVLASYQVCKHIIKTAYMFTMVFFFSLIFLKAYPSARLHFSLRLCCFEKGIESHPVSRIESLTFDPAVVGSWVKPVSEEGSTVYEICYHCSVWQFHLESIHSVSATKKKKKKKETRTHTHKQQYCKKAFSFLILDLVSVSRGFLLPHVEDWALIAAKIGSATSALLNVPAH